MEREDRGRAADLMASALHSSWFCGRPGLVRETAAATARLATSAGVDGDARLSAMTGAALVICGRLKAAEPCLRRSIELATGAEPFVLAYAANSHGWLCEYRAAREAAARALDVAHQLGAEGSVAFAGQLLSEYQCTLGEFDAAAAVWTDTVRVGEETGQPQVIAWSRLGAGYIAANRGGDEEVARLVDSARQLGVPLWFIGADGPASGAVCPYTDLTVGPRTGPGPGRRRRGPERRSRNGSVARSFVAPGSRFRWLEEEIVERISIRYCQA